MATADLVLEGGGVKGCALLGAAAELMDQGYTFSRIAGTSAGAMVGALLAAGIPMATLTSMLETTDMASFADKTGWAKLGYPGMAVSMVHEKGIYKGEAIYQWLYNTLKEHGIETFADLKINDPTIEPNHPERRYKLVCVVSDITRQQMIRLPWDYQAVYGIDPDTQLVADAVCASMGVPLGFKPRTITSAITGQESILVDGGVTSSFPISLFDSPANRTPRWPTFGVRLEGQTPSDYVYPAVKNIVDFIKGLYETATHGRDAMIESDPRVIGRTIFVNTATVNGSDFGITPETRQALYASGRKEAQTFLSTFNFGGYCARQRALRLQIQSAQRPQAPGAGALGAA